MTEESNLLAQDNETEAKIFFKEMCKWKHLDSNRDIKEKNSSKKKYGVDHIFNCFDPFMQKEINILIECKYRKDHKTINSTTIWKQINDLKRKIEISEKSPSWNDTSFHDKVRSSDFGPGVIFLKINKYDHEKFMKNLSSIKLLGTDISSPPVIGVISNYRIAKIVEIIQNKSNLQFFYPVYGKNRAPIHMDHLSFTYLLSDIIVGKYTKIDKSTSQEIYFVLSFEKPTRESVNYIRNAIQMWGIYENVREIYFTEGNISNLQEYRDYKIESDKFDIKITNGDVSLNFKMDDKVNGDNN